MLPIIKLNSDAWKKASFVHSTTLNWFFFTGHFLRSCLVFLCVILQARQHLISIDPANKTILETIQSSLFVLTLDDAKPYCTPDDYTSVTHTIQLGYQPHLLVKSLYCTRLWIRAFAKWCKRL